jgi:hypothetical protein
MRSEREQLIRALFDEYMKSYYNRLMRHCIVLN